MRNPFGMWWRLAWDGRVLAAAVGQLPLTVLNSVVAVAALGRELEGMEGVEKPGETALGVSVGLMGLAGGWVGAMPVCREFVFFWRVVLGMGVFFVGAAVLFTPFSSSLALDLLTWNFANKTPDGAGGLAAQYRFGARSGASIMVLGAVKMAIGLIFGGEGLLKFLGRFPGGVLGIMLAAAGIELAKAGVGIYGHGEALHGVLGRKTDEEVTVVLVTAVAMLMTKNAGAGFIVGMLCHWSYRRADWWERRWIVGERRPLLT